MLAGIIATVKKMNRENGQFGNSVPHTEPLKDGEGPCNWVAGWNQASYMPEMEPQFFEFFDDAKRFILNQLGTIADEYGDTFNNEEMAEEIEGIRQDCNLESGEFAVTVGGVEYWVKEAVRGI